MTYLIYVGLVFVAVLGGSLALFRVVAPDPVKQRMQEMGGGAKGCRSGQ